MDQGSAFTGGKADDIFNALNTATFNALDSLDGGVGAGDTLNVADNAAAVATAGRVVKNIEIANLSSASTVTADTTNWTGLTTLSAVGSGGVNVTAASTTAITASNSGANAMAIIGGGGASSFSTGGAAVTVGKTAVANAFTSVSVTGGTTVDIANNLGTAVATTAATSADTLKTVSVNGNTGNVTIVGKGVTAINATKLVTAGQTVTNTDIDVAHALALGLNGVDAGGDSAATAAATIDFIDAEATSVAVSAATAASYDVTVTAAKATAVTIDAAVKLQMDDLKAGVATAVGIAGAGAVTITANTLAANAVITSTNTGGVTLTQQLATGEKFVGTASSGADSISVAAGATVAHSTGAGNDTVIYGGALAATGSIDAGEGTGDTISMTAAAAATATATATFAGTVSNFEIIEIGATGAATALNMANADGINNLVLNGVTGGNALTVTNAGANFSYTNKAVVAAASSIALASDVGTSDTVSVTYTANDGFADTAAMTIANVENINITTKDADTTAQTTKFTAIITAAAAKTVVIAGDTGVVFTNTGTAITNLDASGLASTVAAAGGLTWTTGALAAASVIKGSAAATNTIDFSAATKVVTYTGGTGADILNFTSANSQANVITLGDGANTVTGVATTTGDNTITGGSGVDTITMALATGKNAINTGAGADVITVGSGANTVTAGAGADKVTIVAGVNANTYTVWTDVAAGDQIAAATIVYKDATATAAGKLGAAVTQLNNAVFQDYLNASMVATDVTNQGAGAATWFQYAGNTYVAIDLGAESATTFVNGQDAVIQLTGLIDLSNSTIAANVLTIV